LLIPWRDAQQSAQAIFPSECRNATIASSRSWQAHLSAKPGATHFFLESWVPYPEEDGDILFTSSRNGRPEVYRLEGAEAVRITHTPGGAGSWGAVSEPDGDIVFTSDRDRKPELYRLLGDESVRISHTPGRRNSWAPYVQPDGTIFFTSDRHDKREVYRLKGAEAIRVTNTPGRWESWLRMWE
jgi:Tol biopolymer transport system component